MKERHAYQRMRERTTLNPQIVDLIERKTQKMKLGKGEFFVPLAKGDRILGYAALRSVGKDDKSVVTTILGPHMTPRGRYVYKYSV